MTTELRKEIEWLEETNSRLVFQTKTGFRSITDYVVIGLLAAPIIFLGWTLLTGSVVGISTHLLTIVGSALPPVFLEAIAPLIILMLGLASTALWFYFCFVWLIDRLGRTVWIFDRSNDTILKKTWLRLGSATYPLNTIQTIQLTCQSPFGLERSISSPRWDSDNTNNSDNTLYYSCKLQLSRVKRKPVVICRLTTQEENYLYRSMSITSSKIHHFLRA